MFSRSKLTRFCKFIVRTLSEKVLPEKKYLNSLKIHNYCTYIIHRSFIFLLKEQYLNVQTFELSQIIFMVKYKLQLLIIRSRKYCRKRERFPFLCKIYLYRIKLYSKLNLLQYFFVKIKQMFHCQIDFITLIEYVSSIKNTYIPVFFFIL